MRHTALVACFAATMAIAPAAQQQPTVIVRGRVLADDTGEPIANARVTTPASSDTLGVPVTLTDDEGRFTLTISRDASRIVASKPGFGRRELTLTVNSPIDIRLIRGGVIEGRVIDELGEPVQFARLYAFDASAANRTGSATPVPAIPAGPPPPPGTPVSPGLPVASSTDTDDRGAYRLASLPPGTYVVAAIAVGGVTQQNGPNGQLMYRPGIHQVFYPDASTVDEAERVSIRGGEQRPGVDIVVAGAQPSGVAGTILVMPPLRSPNARPDAVGSGIIRGRVIATDGQSLPRARVELYVQDAPFQQTATRADNNGGFEFRDLPAGTYRLVAVKTGYGPVVSNVPLQPSFGGQANIRVTIGDRETRERTDITLLRWGTIEGRVLDEHDDPVQGATVQVMQVRYQTGRRRLAAIGFSRRTDDLGRYRLFGVAPGQYVVSAAVGDVQSTDLPGYARAYYPGGSNPSQAQYVSVALDQEMRGIDIPLARTRTARIAGRLIDAAGQPTLGGSVNLMTSQRSPSLANVSVGARIRPDGQFEFTNVAPGQYLIQAYRGRLGRATEGEFGALPVSVDGRDVTDLVLQTSRGSTIQGRVTFDSTDPAKRPAPSAIEITAAPVDFDQSPPSFAIAEIHADWTFDMAGITGPRRLQMLQAPEGWTLADVRVNGVSALDRPLAFGRSDQSLRDVEIIVTDRVSELTGTLTDESRQPAPGGRVVVFPTDRERWYPLSRFLRVTAAGEQGTFTIRGLPFGSYYAAALARLPDEGDDAWQDPGFLSTLLLRASSVTIRDAAKQTLNLQISAPRR